jgi:polyhydroxyalkanoate synthesis regulator phasin
MKLCGDGCAAVCDFCEHYRDNGLGSGKGFAGYGICALHGHETGAADMCEDFECFQIKVREGALSTNEAYRYISELKAEIERLHKLYERERQIAEQAEGYARKLEKEKEMSSYRHAEYAGELREQISALKRNADEANELAQHYYARWKAVQDREKLVEALLWYASEENYDGSEFRLSEIEKDSGQRARDILREIGVMVE